MLKPMEQYGYPFEDGKRGLLLEGLEPTNEFRPLRTAKGKPVQYIFTNHSLFINDGFDDLLGCGYKLFGQVVGGRLSFSVYTYAKPFPLCPWKTQHSHFFATKFAEAFYQHMISQGVEIQTLGDFWPVGSDNYRQYHQALQFLHDPVLAAQRTWEGRLARKLGFDRLEPQDVGEYPTYRYGSEVRVEFRRTQSALVLAST